MAKLWWIIAFVAACEVGSAGPTGGGQSPDASTGGGGGRMDGSSSSGGGPMDAPNNGCIAQQASPGDGHHNAGQDCMNGCHNHGFTIAGTVFTQAGGTTPVVGATVHIVQANGTTLNLVTMNNGNFYTSQTLAFPLTVNASSCPDLQAMTATVTGPSPQGCNKSGCYVNGNRIHLP